MIFKHFLYGVLAEDINESKKVVLGSVIAPNLVMEEGSLFLGEGFVIRKARNRFFLRIAYSNQ